MTVQMKSFAAALLLAVSFVPFAGAQEVGAREKDAAVDKVQYSVWSGFCSRSLRSTGTFADAASACRHASGIRKTDGHVMVLAGRPGELDFSAALRVLRHLQKPDAPFECANCSIYARGCRGGWRKLGADTDCVVTAEARARKSRDEGTPAEVIYHAAAPETVQTAR